MDVLKSFIDISKAEFDAYVDSIDMASIRKAAEIILEAKKNGNRLHITGIGKPAHIAGYARRCRVQRADIRNRRM